MLFHTHLQARELCPQTYSLSLPLEWSQVTHTPASIKSGGAHKPEKLALYSTLARQLTLRQALYTQMANHHIR